MRVLLNRYRVFYLVHVRSLMTLFYVEIRAMHWYTFIPLYSRCYTPTTFTPQGAILREQTEQNACPNVNITLKSSVLRVTWQLSNCQTDNCHVIYSTLLFNLIFTSGHAFCSPCSHNVSALPEVGPLRAETCRNVTVWINGFKRCYCVSRIYCTVLYNRYQVIFL